MFRNQHPLGETGYANTYWIYFTQTQIEFTRYVAGAATPLGVWAWAPPPDEWHRFRLTWYSGTDGDGSPALVIILEHQVAGEWVQLGGNVYDLDEHWKDSEINRMGAMASTFYGYPSWVDDTELYQKG